MSVLLAVAVLLGGGTAAWHISEQSETFTYYVRNYDEVRDKTNGFSLEQVAHAEPVRIAFVGDLMLDRGIRQIAGRLGYEVFLAGIAEIAQEVDVVVGNLEGPITTHASKSIYTDSEDGQDHFTFTFAPEVATHLASAGVSVVSLANNHALDFGAEGLVQTRAHLRDAGIGFFGDPHEPAYHIHMVEREDMTVALVGYNQFGSPHETETREAIARARADSDWVIVMPHWGEEYTTEITDTQYRLARDFIEAGADVVMGAHPHVIQRSERYQDGVVYYSLGNAVFDQWFSADVSCGLAVLVTLDPKQGVVFEERFFWSTSRGVSVVAQCPEQV